MSGATSVAKPSSVSGVLVKAMVCIIILFLLAAMCSTAVTVPDTAGPGDSGKSQFPRNYCGQDTQKYYALRLLDETLANLEQAGVIELFGSSTILDGWDNGGYASQTRQIVEEWHNRNCWDIQGTSPFDEYKRLREVHNSNSVRKEWLKQFSADMSIEDAYQICQRVVQNWF